MRKGGRGRNAFCALLFSNRLINCYIHHHFHVKCVDLPLKQNKTPTAIFAIP